MSCAKIATYLDEEMLTTSTVTIAESHGPDDNLPRKAGDQVEKEISGRYLLRYLTRREIGQYLRGNGNKHFVTPTAYSSSDCISWLALPAVNVRRTHVLLLKPSEIKEIWGPRRIKGGFGIEYLLPYGFPQQALAFAWELEI